MNKKQLLPCGCGGEAEYYESPINGKVLLSCRICGIETKFYDTKSEAITAWNKAMGDVAKIATTERTAKVIKHKYWLGVSLNIVGEQTIGYEWICENCKKLVREGDNYCSHCGSKLIWNEDVQMEYFESGER